MKTQFFTLALIAANVFMLTTANGQRKIISGLPVKQSPAYEKNVTVSAGCNIVNYPVPPGINLVYYVTGTNGKDGYVAGPNIYGDKQKANYFDLKGKKYGYIQGVKLDFGKAASNKSSSRKKNLYVRVFDVTGDGQPGKELYVTSIKFSKIAVATDSGKLVKITFDSAVQIPSSGKFFVSLDISTLEWSTPGTRDSLTLISTEDGEVVPGQGWEQWSDNTWYDMNTSWGGLNIALGIFPVVSETSAGCHEGIADAINSSNSEDAVSAKKENNLRSVIFANPFNGALKLQLNLANPQTVSVKVYDLQGRLAAMEKPTTYNGASNTIVLNSTANLKSGTYILKLNAGTEERTYKIVKQ